MSENKKTNDFKLTESALDNLSKNEQWVLTQFICLPPQSYTIDSFNTLTKSKGKRQVARRRLPKFLDSLTSKGWLVHNNATKTYQINGITVDVVRESLDLKETAVAELIKHISAHLARKLKTDFGRSFIQSALGLKERSQTEFNSTSTILEDNSSIEKPHWIPYGKILLNHFKDSDSLKISKLQGNLVSTLKELGKYEEAKILLEEIIKSNERNCEENRAQTVLSYYDLATILQELGEYNEAKILVSSNCFQS